MQEAECLRSLKHPNIIELCETFIRVRRWVKIFRTNFPLNHHDDDQCIRMTIYASSWSTQTAET